MKGDRGFLFVFNPNYQQKSAAIKLDAAIGYTSQNQFLLREVYPQSDKLVGKPGVGVWNSGDTIHLKLDGTSATVLEIVPVNEEEGPAIFNAGAVNGERLSKPQTKTNGDRLEVIGAAGEPGELSEIGVLTSTATKIHAMTVNGHNVSFVQKGRYVAANVKYAGQTFHQAQQVTLAPGKNETLEGAFTIPARVLQQLDERKKAWPIPWNAQDYETTWLAPERLLLFVQFAEGTETMRTVATLDGKPLELKAAYTSTRVHPASFVGFYADISHVTVDQKHQLGLQLTGEAKDKLLGVFFDNVEPQLTNEVAP